MDITRGYSVVITILMEAYLRVEQQTIAIARQCNRDYRFGSVRSQKFLTPDNSNFGKFPKVTLKVIVWRRIRNSTRVLLSFVI